MLLAILALPLTAIPAAADFTLDNLRFTLYHEVGHAVIDQYRIPLTGPEEAAADGFALLLADRLLTVPNQRDMIVSLSNLERADVSHAYDPWAGYMTDGERLAWLICVWYGLDPGMRGDMARALGMPADAAENCAEVGQGLRAAWNPVFERARLETKARPSLVAGQPGKALRLLAQDIARLNEALTLPNETTVDVEFCGEDNAFYYQNEDRIVLCSEMTDTFRRRAREVPG